MTDFSGTRFLSAACALALGASVACTSDTSPPVTSNPPPTPPDPVWVQVWSDEFDGPAGASIDGTKWGNDISDGCQQGICGWGNEEREYYTDASGDPRSNTIFPSTMLVDYVRVYAKQ